MAIIIKIRRNVTIEEMINIKEAKRHFPELLGEIAYYLRINHGFHIFNITT